MEDISEFVYSQNIIEKNADFTGLLLQLYYSIFINEEHSSRIILRKT